MNKILPILLFIDLLLAGFLVGSVITRIPDTQQPPTFYFDGDDEVSRIYYEGFIQFRTDDNSFQIIFETPRNLKDVTVR